MGDTDGGESFTKHKGRNYEDGGLGETGGYVAEGTQEGLEGKGNISNPQALTEGDTLKPQEGESGFSFKDLAGGNNGGGVKESVKGLTGSDGGKGIVDSVKDLAGGGGGEGQSLKDLTGSGSGQGVTDTLKDLAGGGGQGQSVKDLTDDKWGGK